MPPDKPFKLPIIELASNELRGSIENSRELVRKSHELIELSEADRPAPAGSDDTGTAN
jgi:hypothetical protein